MFAWGIIFLVAAVCIYVLKKERPLTPKFNNTNTPYDVIMHTYRELYEIIKLPSVQLLAFGLLTNSMFLSANDKV